MARSAQYDRLDRTQRPPRCRLSMQVAARSAASAHPRARHTSYALVGPSGPAASIKPSMAQSVEDQGSREAYETKKVIDAAPASSC